MDKESSNNLEVTRVNVKDIKKIGACLTCRTRKKKCDGNTPCSYISEYFDNFLFNSIIIMNFWK